jgi:hypothetical protein
MMTNEHRDDEGRIISFEVTNIGRARARRVIERRFPSAIVKHQRGDEFAVLLLNGRTFILTEPWGDNSRYLVHEREPKSSVELEMLRCAFEDFQPSAIFSGSPFFIVFLSVAAGLIGLIVGIIWILQH